MRRREIITLLAGAAVTWPLSVRAQQPERMRRIGVLMNYAADDRAAQTRLTVFLQQMQRLGWSEGRNLHSEVRWGAEDAQRIQKAAAELVALAPDVALVAGSPAAGPLLQATRTLPIVFVQVADPVGAGFVQSLSHPGGNATGFSNFEYGTSAKWLDLLKKIEPQLSRVAVMRDPNVASGGRTVGRNPDGGGVIGGRIEPSQHHTGRRDRPCGCCIRHRSTRWPDCDGRWSSTRSPRANHRARSASPAASDLFGSCIRDCWRANGLRP